MFSLLRFACVSTALVFFVTFAHMDVARAADTAFPLKVSANGRHLVDQNEVPFLLNGDTVWVLLQSATKSEVQMYLDDRKARGFNGVLFELIEILYGGPENRDGERPFLQPEDFTQPNEAYFAHADWVIDQALQRDMVVVVAPAYLGFGCGSDGYCQQLAAAGPEVARQYGRWVGARYRNYPNIIWTMGGDSQPSSSAEIAAHEAVIAGILEEDTTHLVTGHCTRHNAALDCYDRSWLTLNATYTWCDETPAESKVDYERLSRAPFIYYEGGYENDGTPEYCMRAQAYWSTLSGSSGHLYGSYPLWGLGSGWQSNLSDPGGASLEHYASLFASRHWHLLEPDFSHTVLTSGYGGISGPGYVGSALTSDGKSFIAYMPTQLTVTVNLGRLSGTSVKAWWFNPLNGAATSIGTFAASGSRSFTPPEYHDWVLVIDDEAAGLPPPGQGTVGTPPSQLGTPGNFIITGR